MTTPLDARIPVTILTGFLGSGKTTLLNHILTANHGKRIAVIENEFGEIGIDNALVIGADEELFEMNNGCICCTVRGDLIRILNQLMKRRDKFDYILVETTGIADPGPVAQTFFVDDEMKTSFRLDGIVTVVDAKHVWQHLDESEECQAQIAFADTILLNKTDLVSDAEIPALEARLRKMNAAATLYRTQNAQLPVDQVVNIRAFDLDHKLSLNADFLQEELPFEWGGLYRLGAGTYDFTFQLGPDPLMDLVILPVADDRPETLHEERLTAMKLFSAPASPVKAGGGIVPGLRLHKLLFDDAFASSFTLRIPAAGLYALYTQHGPDEFQMTFTREAQAIAPLLTREYSLPGHEHDETVTSVGIEETRELDPRRLNAWMSELVQVKGTDIFRMKGILNIKGSPNRFVFQGIHMLFEGKMDRPWAPDEIRRSQLVFIGRNLDREELNRRFRRCLV
ncbi:MAG: GTP-binding protein [Verrucomicrobiae bacterium]|nr:GTP-binding protein [Verrucomicrobiae bacterium]